MVFQQRPVIGAVNLGDPDFGDEAANGFGADTATAQATNGGHPWIIPTSDEFALDQFHQLALAHDGEGQVETVKLILVWDMDVRQLI